MTPHSFHHFLPKKKDAKKDASHYSSPEGQDGRDHNVKAFTLWMAGGGVKPGTRYEAIEGQVSIHDWHATILHLLGLDHEALTYRHAGRDFRLTDVYGRVVKEIVG